MAKNMEELVNYCKQYGYIFQGSEIYGGLANSWDYGSLGRELKIMLKMHGGRSSFKKTLMLNIEIMD